MLRTDYFNEYRKFELKKKNLILIAGILSAIVGTVAMTQRTEWELAVEFKAKSEKQIEHGQVNRQQLKMDKEINQP